MPEEFDPAWEYRVGDETGVFDVSHLDNPGVRFGSGLIDRTSLFENHDPKPDDPRAIRCGGCRRWFIPDRSSRKFCSNVCVPRPGTKPKRPKRACDKCGRMYQPYTRPAGRESKFCGTRCSARSRGPTTDELIEFGRDYLSGLKMADLAVKYGVSAEQLKRWRRRLKLPPRGPRGAPPSAKPEPDG